MINLLGWSQKCISFLIDNNSEHQRAKGVNKNVVATISHNKHKDVLLNNKCIRHSMSRIQSKDQNICPKQWIWSIDSWLPELIRKKTVILITIRKNFFVKHIVLISSLIRTAFLSSIFSLVRTAFLLVYKNIVRLLGWHSKFKKRKALKKR